jgi:hypothetical protein
LLKELGYIGTLNGYGPSDVEYLNLKLEYVDTIGTVTNEDGKSTVNDEFDKKELKRQAVRNSADLKQLKRHHD